MKKVLFVCYGLGIGGIEKCLVNLINVLPEEKFDIDILLMNPECDLKKQIARKVNFIDRFQYVMNTTDTMSEIQSNGGIFKNLGIFFRYCGFRFSVRYNGNPWKWFKKIHNQYDVAIAYSHHDYSPFFVIDKVCANRKVVWYHNGKYDKIGKEFLRDAKYFKLFDVIVAVSSDCANVLIQKFRDEKEKIIVLRNICNTQDIIKKASDFIPNSFITDGLHIVTVGRLTKEKGADIALDVCCQLYNRKYPVTWHWIGDGNQRQSIEKEIDKRGLDGVFVLEGNQENPYPFIQYCDIYVQTSYYEAYSTTITEAKVLGKPIITTDVGGMRDQLQDGINGFIVPVDVDRIIEKIILLIENRELLEQFTDTLKKETIVNESALLEYYKTVFQ